MQSDVDFILTPSSPVTRTSTARNLKTHRRGGNLAYTSPFKQRTPRSVPARWPKRRSMPMGMQLIGLDGSEFDLLRAARAISGAFELPPFPNLERMAGRVRR